MLLSLLKQLMVPAAAKPARANVEDLPSFNFEELERKIVDKVEARRTHYLDWPAFVHLETISLCNAACDFCPYPSLERKGTRMPDALIEKIISELCEVPPDVRFQLAPYKVSEPFLEPRLFDILEEVNARLPNAYISIITNGAALTERKIDQLRAVKNVAYLSVSVNFDNPEEYEAVMKIPFERTVRRLEVLHRRKLSGDLAFPVRLSRVSDNMLTDTRFVRWVQTNYPAFQPIVVNRNDWIGDVAWEAAVAEVPDVPCHRWFDMSITATGKVAMCCMDSEGKYPKGDVNTSHVLEIYNQPHLRRIREQLVSRRTVGAPCDRCTYLNY